jgi:predicted MFS family arabinose efflux permease
MNQLAEVRSQLLAFSLTRLVVNTGYRMVYPFLPAIARGVGVDLLILQNAIALRSGLGAVGPLLGSVADSRGRKTAMIFGMSLFVVGMILVALWPTFPALVIALLLTAASKIVFDSAMQAYLGDRVHYSQRGLAIALTEFGWSGAFLLGVPLVGWLIARTDWHSPFIWLALLSLAGTFWLWRVIPSDSPQAASHQSLRQGLGMVLSHRAAVAVLGVSILLSSSNEIVNIVYGDWMESTFGLQIAALGAASIVIGVAELVGEGLVAGLVDRLGKRRAVAAGLIFYAVASLLLPAVGGTLQGALFGLFLFFLGFEFTLVSIIPMMTELVPGARATLMSANLTAFSLGKAAGGVIGPALFVHGLPVNSIVAAIFNLVALGAVILFVHEQANQPTNLQNSPE